MAEVTLSIADGPATLMFAALALVFVLIVALVIASVVIAGAVILRKSRTDQVTGADPVGQGVQLLSKLKESVLPAPAEPLSIAERLAQVNQLASDAAITNDEAEALRARILGSL